jgi:hypothetical protein
MHIACTIDLADFFRTEHSLFLNSQRRMRP